ncbi:MAG: hypothetical protein D6699_06900 [Aquificota bacterium]|nr:MAG: hypothetical protein D6699_06900 [Aquificota bacterium]
MRSWVYLIGLRGYYEDGKAKESSAVYVVALPPQQELAQVNMECYATEYLPQNIALTVGKAYAVGTDWEIKEPERFKIKGFREDLELYVFEEGLSFEEGLIEVLRIVYEDLANGGKLLSVEPVIDVGTPSTQFMLECVKKAIST